jgi:antitoxin component of MazEF toxin-antitoxin module
VSKVPSRATIGSGGVLKIPLRTMEAANVRAGVEVTIEATDETIVVRRTDPDQAWFWTAEWQAKGREVEEGRARGETGLCHESDEAFLESLRERTHADDR